MKKILIVLLALFVVFAMLGCDSGTPGKKSTTTEDDKDKDKDKDNTDKVELPVIYANGKFLDGVTLTVGTNGTFSGKKSIEVSIGDLSDGSGKKGHNVAFTFDEPVEFGSYTEIEVDWGFSGFSSIEGIGGYRNRFVNNDVGGGNSITLGYDWKADAKAKSSPFVLTFADDYCGKPAEGDAEVGDWDDFDELTIQWGKIMWDSWSKYTMEDDGKTIVDDVKIYIYSVKLK